jgi:F-type H+-transporting ATPase subunit epsilon
LRTVCPLSDGRQIYWDKRHCSLTDTFTAEGILEVKDHKTVLMSEAAEWPEEIDTERAKTALERAEETLKSGGMKFEIDKAKASLKKAQCRMKVAEEKADAGE